MPQRSVEALMALAGATSYGDPMQKRPDEIEPIDVTFVSVAKPAKEPRPPLGDEAAALIVDLTVFGVKLWFGTKLALAIFIALLPPFLAAIEAILMHIFP